MPREQQEAFEHYKINVYMYLWEMLPRSRHLFEFEQRYVQALLRASSTIPSRNIHLKAVLTDFYQAQGIDAAITVGNSTIIIRKHIANPNDNLILSRFVKELDRAPQTLHKVEGRKDLYYLEQSSLERLFARASGVPFDFTGEGCLGLDEKLEILKAGVRQVFGLGNRDALFLCSQQLFIKYFSKLIEEEKDRRFGGIPEETMCQLYHSLKGFDYKKMLLQILRQLLSGEINLQTIDNLTFHKTYIKALQNRLRTHLQKQIEDQALAQGFANYILRAHFTLLLNAIAEEIFDLVLKKHENIKKFIAFYDGGEIRIGEKRYTKPAIMIAQEQWSFVPIHAFLLQKANLEQKITTKDTEVGALREEIKKLERSLNELAIEQKMLREMFEACDMEASEVHLALKKMQHEYMEMQKKVAGVRKKEEKAAFESRLESLKTALQEQGKRDAALLEKRNQNAKELERTQLKGVELQRKLETLLGNLALEEQKLAQMTEELKPMQKKETQLKGALASAILKFRI